MPLLVARECRCYIFQLTAKGGLGFDDRSTRPYAGHSSGRQLSESLGLPGSAGRLHAPALAGESEGRPSHPCVGSRIPNPQSLISNRLDPNSPAWQHAEMMIRRIEQGDHDAWLRLRRAFRPECATDTFEAEMADILADRDNQAVFVAVRPAGGLGGFVEASIHPHAIGCDTRPVGYLEGWYVDADLRRTGVGRGLLAAAESWARSKGCLEMASDTWFDNEVGLASHQACGYTVTGKLIHFKKRL